VDARGDFRLFLVCGRKHFDAGVDVVHEMKHDGFRGFGFDRRAELELAVMGGHQMQQVQADILRCGREGFPFLQREFPPEGVDQLDPDADVPEEFAADFTGHVEALFRRAHFPEFSRVVEKHPGEKEVAVQVGVDIAERGGGPHHLSGVAEQAAAMGMVVEPCRCGALKPFAVFRQEQRAERPQPRVSQALHDPLKIFEIPVDRRLRFRCSREELLRLARFERAHPPASAVEAERAVDEEFPLDFHRGSAVGFPAGIEGRSVGPGPQGQGVGGVAEFEFPEGFAIRGFLFVDLVDLPADPAVHGTGPAVLANLGN